MTKEEAIDILHKMSEDNFYGTHVQEACKIAVEALSKCTIPSNLDEAALKAYPKMSRLSEPHGVIPADNKTYYLGDANEENRDAFKVGAKWMSKQGFSFQDEVIFCGSTPFLKDADFDILEAPESFKPGDKVIVQIRKKEE